MASTSEDASIPWRKWLQLWTPPILVDLYRGYRSSQTQLAPAPAASASASEHQVELALPTRSISEIFPEADLQQVILLSRQIPQHHWAMPSHELLVLGAICRTLEPDRILEIGTFVGAATLTLAANTPPTARIMTVDLPPDVRPTHRHGLGVGGFPDFEVGALYRGTDFEAKIEQYYADSTRCDFAEFEHQIDFVFIDADHTYDFVRRDTETARRLLKPGGAILWHDYTWEPPHSECAGVTRCVNEFLDRYSGCVHIAGTRFAIYLDTAQAPASLEPACAGDDRSNKPDS